MAKDTKNRGDEITTEQTSKHNSDLRLGVCAAGVALGVISYFCYSAGAVESALWSGFMAVSAIGVGGSIRAKWRSGRSYSN